MAGFQGVPFQLLLNFAGWVGKACPYQHQKPQQLACRVGGWCRVGATPLARAPRAIFAPQPWAMCGGLLG
jgi:hypothetical protein